MVPSFVPAKISTSLLTKHPSSCPYQKNEVSHYLDHIQPQIDDLARREKHLFQGLDPEALPEALRDFFGVSRSGLANQVDR